MEYDIINDEKTLGFKKDLLTGVLGDQYYSDKYTVYMLENHPLFDITEKKDRVGGMVLDIETLDSTSWISRGVEVNGLLSKFINSVLIHTNLEKGRLMVGRNVKLTNCYIESGWEGDAVIRKSEIENVKIIGRFGGVNIKKSKINNKSDIFKVRSINKAEPNLRQRFYKVEMNNASITFPDGELLCNNLVMRGSSHIHLENPQDIIISDVVMDKDAEIEIEGNQNLTITNVDLREYSSLKIKISGTKDAASVDNLIVQPWNTKTIKI